MTLPQTSPSVAARIDRLPLLSLHRRLVAILGIGTFFDLYDIFLGGVLAAVLAHPYHLHAMGKAAVIGSAFLGMFFGASVLGVVSDRVGRRAMYLVDLLLYSAFSLAAAFAPSLSSLLIFRFLAGVGLGAGLPLLDIYIGEFVPRQARGRYTALAVTFGFLGVPLAALGGQLLASRIILGLPGWRWLLIAGSLGALIVWLVRRGLPESPRWYETRGRVDEADAQMRELERTALREHHLDRLPEPERVVIEPARRTSVIEMFRKCYLRRSIMLLIADGLLTVGYYGFGSLAPLVLAHKGFTIVSSLGYLGLISLGYPLGTLLAIPLMERVERKWLIASSAAAMALLGLGFGLATALPIILACGFLFTIVSNVCGIALHVYQAEVFPTRIRGTAVGLAYSLSRLSGAILPFAALPLLEAAGATAVFLGAGVVMGIVALDVCVLGPRTTGRSLEAISPPADSHPTAYLAETVPAISV